MDECEKIMITFSRNGFLRPIDLETLFLIVLDILYRPNEHLLHYMDVLFFVPYRRSQDARRLQS